jgi:hypothetical protein
MPNAAVYLMNLVPGPRLLIFASRASQALSKNDCFPAYRQPQPMQGVVHLPNSKSFFLLDKRLISKRNAPRQTDIRRKQENRFLWAFLYNGLTRKKQIFFRV